MMATGKGMILGNSPEQPYFSVIVPLHNRSATIERCVESCLIQDFHDYELIIIDDGSTDNSMSAVGQYEKYPFVKIVPNKRNRGVCHARGAGVEKSRGRWLIFIDSDDAFIGGAFKKIFVETHKVPEDVSEIRFCYFCKAINRVTPIPMMPAGVLDFEKYLKWYESYIKLGKRGNSDLLYCQRREIYEWMKWPEDRQQETLYHVKLASRIKMMMSPEVVGIMFDDADNRITSNVPEKNIRLKIQRAKDNADMRASILSEFGSEIRMHAPTWYKHLFRNTGRLYLQANMKREGLRYLCAFLRKSPLDLAGWTLLLLGAVHPELVDKCLTWLRR